MGTCYSEMVTQIILSEIAVEVEMCSEIVY